MTDLHLHTHFSHDSKECTENYISAAKKGGFNCLGFSEHYDYDVLLEGGGESCPLPDLKGYFNELAALSKKYPEVAILKGIELGYINGVEERYNSLLRENAFDYAILSVHILKGRGDCYFPEFFAGLSKKQAYGEYFKAVLDSVCSGVDFQIVGHLGYIERYAPYAEKRIVYGEFSDILDEILKQIISRGKCLELNTSVKGTQGITIPNAEITERYIELGGKNFSLGSDAHSAERFAQNFNAVKDFLISRGINHTCRFEKRKLIKENF